VILPPLTFLDFGQFTDFNKIYSRNLYKLTVYKFLLQCRKIIFLQIFAFGI